MGTLYKLDNFHPKHYKSNKCQTSRPITREKDSLVVTDGIWLSTPAVSKIQNEIRKLHKNFHLTSDIDLIQSIISLVKSSKPNSSIPAGQNPSPELMSNRPKPESSKDYKSASITSSNEEGTETFDEKIRTLSVKEIHLEEILRRLKRKEKTLDLIKADLIKEKVELVENKRQFNGIKDILVQRLGGVEDKVKKVSEMFVRIAGSITKGNESSRKGPGLEDEMRIFHKSCEVLEQNKKDLDEIAQKTQGILGSKSDVLVDCCEKTTGTGRSKNRVFDKLESTLENIDFYLNQLHSSENRSKYHERRKSMSSDINSSLSLSSVLHKTPKNSIKPTPHHSKTQSLQEASLSILAKERELTEKQNKLLQEKEKLKKDSEILFNIHKDFEQKKEELEKVRKELKKDREAINGIVETHERLKEASKANESLKEASNERKVIFQESLKNLVKKQSLHYSNQDWVVRVFDHDHIEDGN